MSEFLLNIRRKGQLGKVLNIIFMEGLPKGRTQKNITGLFGTFLPPFWEPLDQFFVVDDFVKILFSWGKFPNDTVIFFSP